MSHRYLGDDARRFQRAITMREGPKPYERGDIPSYALTKREEPMDYVERVLIYGPTLLLLVFTVAIGIFVWLNVR